jgi:hypothetical protein
MFQEILADGHPIHVLQVWVDPARPKAHRDPMLRAYLALMAERHRMAALIRWGYPDQEGREAMFLAAPCLSDDGEWIERRQAMISSEAMREKLALAKIA